MAYRRRTFRKTTKKGYRKTSRKSRYGMSKIKRSIKQLYRKVQGEKKHATSATISGNTVALYNDVAMTLSGHRYLTPDVSGAYSFFPLISRGTHSDQRVGDKIRLCSAYIRIRVQGQSSFVGDAKVTLFVLTRKHDSLVGDVATNFIEGDRTQSATNTILTNMSGRNMNQFNQYNILARRDVWLPADEFVGQTDQTIREVVIRLRLNHSVQYRGTNELHYGGFSLLALCNRGINAQNSGVLIWPSVTVYYYDN